MSNPFTGPIPPIALPENVHKVWLFTQNADGTMSPGTSGGGGGGNVNITGINGSAPALSNPLAVELSDGSNAFGTVINPLSVNVLSGGGSNPSVGTTGAAAPTSATEMGIIVAGLLQAVSAANPLPISAASLPLPALAATSTKQSDGSQKTQVVDGAGNVIGSTGNALDVNIKTGISNPLPVSATQTTSPWVVAGNRTNNNAAPDGGNAGVLPSVANAAPPAYTEGNLVLQSADLQGSTRVTPSGFPQIVQKTSNTSTGSVASLAKAFASNVSRNSTIIVVCGVGNGTTPTVTDSAGNTYTNDIVKANGAAFNMAIFHAISATAGANTVTVNNGGTAASIAMEIYEVAGLLTLTNVVLDGTNGNTATSATPSTNSASGALNTTFQQTPYCYAFGGIGVGTAAQTITITAGTQGFVNDSGQLNPTTPAGLFSFAAASAFCAIPQPVTLAGTITSEPWSAVVALYRPVTMPVQGNVRMMVKSGTSSSVVDFPVAGVGNATDTLNVSLVASNSSSTGENVNIRAQSPGGAGGNAIPSFAMVAATGPVSPTGTTSSAVIRTPNVWRGSQFSAAGQNNIWVPPATKKVRLMNYQIEVGEDATLSGGPLPINLSFCEKLGTSTGATLAYPGFGYTHRLVIPAAVLATSYDGYISNWINLGNGQLLTTAGAALQMGIMVPQTTGAVNPTWTIASNQWEAATVGFKTNGNTGNFKLIQQTNAVASAASVALPAVQSISGNAIYVIIRITRAVGGGTPTVVVTDTAGNTYTNSAFTTNATDNANGSIILIASSTNIVGNAANIVTVTTSVNAATQLEAIYLEYAGMGSVGVDAALVGVTGNSTSPASGNYTPATAGDLIFSFFGTSASIASQPTVGSNFNIRGSLFNATQGCLAVADNFGNGSLTTGLVNVVVAGTEE